MPTSSSRTVRRSRSTRGCAHAGRPVFGHHVPVRTQAGSSLADITTKAVPAGDGTYRVSGTKMWISGGE